MMTQFIFFPKDVEKFVKKGLFYYGLVTILFTQTLIKVQTLRYYYTSGFGKRFFKRRRQHIIFVHF